MEIFGVYTVHRHREPGGGCFLPLSLIYRRMQRVVERGYTHTAASLFTHTYTHTGFHVIKVCLPELCSVHKLARRPVSVIKN